MRIILVSLLLLTIAAGISAATVKISGFVKDDKGAAITGAIVTLKTNSEIKDSTDTNGAFTISDATSNLRIFSSKVNQNKISQIYVKDNQLYFTLNSTVESGAMSLFTSDGSKCHTIEFAKLDAGTNTFEMPSLAPGMYILHISFGSSVEVFQFIASSDAVVVCTAEKIISAQNNLRSAVTSALPDTLIIEKTGYAISKKEITSYEQANIQIVLLPSNGSSLPPITDYFSKGPFKTIVEKNVGPNNAYTVFRPDPLGQNGFLHAPIIFGPGIGQTVQPVHTELLTNFASHGFVVVGTPVLSQGPGGAQNLKSMQDGLNWIVKQNTAEGIYKGKLLVDKVVSMGFSVGGTSAVQLGGAPEIFTVVSIHGHQAEAALHGPMLQTTGTKDNVGMPLQQKTYDASKVQTFLATLTGASHPYIESNGGGEERKAIVAWLRYWIYNDAGAKQYFYGNDCILCKSPWEKPQRKNWN